MANPGNFYGDDPLGEMTAAAKVMADHMRQRDRESVWLWACKAQVEGGLGQIEAAEYADAVLAEYDRRRMTAVKHTFGLPEGGGA